MSSGFGNMQSISCHVCSQLIYAGKVLKDPTIRVRQLVAKVGLALEQARSNDLEVRVTPGLNWHPCAIPNTQTDSLNGPHSIHIVVKRREAGTGPSFAAQPAPSTPEPVLQTSSEASSSTAAGNPSPSTAVPTVAPPLADDGEQAIDEEVDSWVRQVSGLGFQTWGCLSSVHGLGWSNSAGLR
jgi:hypothetical protein